MQTLPKQDMAFTNNLVVFMMIPALILYIFFYIKPVIGMACPESTKSVRNVDRCPRNALEWDVREDLFNCSSYHQTCVMASKFVYHCVLNADGTKLLEVCAPYKYIHGQRCAEFDSKGGIIQESANRCDSHIVPCSNVYNSMEAFKYQSCYDGIVPKKETGTTVDPVNVPLQSCAPSIITTIGVVTGIVTFIFSLVGILIYKREYTLMPKPVSANSTQVRLDGRERLINC